MQKLKDYLSREGWKKDWKETKNDRVGLVKLTIAGTAIVAIPTMGLFLNPLYHLSGAMTGLIACITDNASTIPSVKLANSEKFKKYGLDRIFQEENPILGKNPTMEQYAQRRLLSGALKIAACTVCPPAGYAYLLATPLLIKNNREDVKNIREALENKMAENLEICLWKLVANKDEAKIARGDENITLSPDKSCFKCDGSREHAKKIECKFYEVNRAEYENGR